MIRTLAIQAIARGILPLDAERQLRQLLHQTYSYEDFQAFMQLQFAVLDGQVRQESRERLRAQLLA